MASALGLPEPLFAQLSWIMAKTHEYVKNLFNGFHKLNSLQYVRALCAIAVVMYHAEGGANQYWQSTGKISLFSWGHLGVPMFFCLSGFIIAYSGYLRPKRWWEFFYSRFARIYPAYIATAAAFVACLIFLPAGTFNSVPSVSIEQFARTLLFDFGRTGGYVYVG
jgi:peptidoglycan/LPS O-acetylase OafA/YrhL